jgi:hypothetical protein
VLQVEDFPGRLHPPGRQIFTRPYTPKTNGKAERCIQTAIREWAYARAYQNSVQQSAELVPWLHRDNWHRPHASLKANAPISRLGLTGDNVLRFYTSYLSYRHLIAPGQHSGLPIVISVGIPL